MQTQILQSIILSRKPFREKDTKIILYSRERGKLELVARGTKKSHSKLAGHLEPIILSQIMLVPGRRFDYIGSARADNCFLNIKNNLEKLWLAGRALDIFNRVIKEEEKDENIFNFLLNFLEIINKDNFKPIDSEAVYYIFTLKFLQELGYAPELYNCLECGRKIIKQKRFTLTQHGLVCFNCRKNLHKENILIDDQLLKYLRLTFNSSFDNLIKSKVLCKKKLREISQLLFFNTDVPYGCCY